MIQPPETVRVTRSRVACDGASDIPGGAALGHPRIYMEIDEKGYVDCGYCDRRFVLIGGPADISTAHGEDERSEEHTSELQSLMRISYAVFCLKKKNKK